MTTNIMSSNNDANQSNQPILPEAVIKGVPKSQYHKIRKLNRKISNRYELIDNPFGEVYYDKTDLLKVLFPNKDWTNILNFSSKGDPKNGSIYNLKELLDKHFELPETALIKNRINEPDRLCKSTTVVGIEAIYSVPFDKYNNFLLAGKHLFKVKKSQSIDDEGAVEIGLIPSQHYLTQSYPLELDRNGLKEWFLMYKEVTKSFYYITEFLTRQEYDNYSRKMLFKQSLTST